MTPSANDGKVTTPLPSRGQGDVEFGLSKNSKNAASLESLEVLRQNAAVDPSEPVKAVPEIHVPALRSPVAPPVPDRRSQRPWLLIFAGLVIVVLAGLLYLRPWEATLTGVVTEVMAPGPVTRVLAVNGKVAASRSISVRSAVGGTLKGPLADEGDRVAAGDVLAQLDTASPQAVMQQARASLVAGEIAERQAAVSFLRTEALSGIVARVTLEDAARMVESAKSEVRRLRALTDQAQIELDRYTVKAPIAGSILSRAVDPGQLIDPSMALFMLADLSQLVVEADVDETYAAQIALGQAAMLQLTGETQTRPGHVSFVSPEVTAATGGLLVKIGFDVVPAIPVGLTVTANITVDDRPAALTAPRSAIVTDAAGSAVFVLADGKAQQTPVTVVDWPAARLLVTSGLVAGDRLIVTAAGIADGQAVTAADD